MSLTQLTDWTLYVSNSPTGHCMSLTQLTDWTLYVSNSTHRLDTVCL